MELLGFKLFEKKKPEASSQPAPPEANMVTHVDQQLAGHHQEIEKNVALATNQPSAPGSSVPAINNSPVNPMDVIQGADKVDPSAQTEAIINSTMPDSYKKATVGERFGDMKNAVDHLTGLDANRYTTADRFTEMIQKKSEEKAAILNPAELKKAA